MADNILTYILELQDKISPKLKVINISNDKMLEKWSEIQVKMNAARKSMSDTGNSIGSLNEKIAALRMQREWIPGSNTAAIRATNHEIQRLEKEVQRLESLDGGKFKKWMNDITGSIPALVNPLSMIGTGMVLSVKKGMETELQKQNITSLLAGDVDAAETLFNQISEYGKKTVYDKAGLIDAQKTMMSFGLSGETAFKTLKQIGDIAMGDANKMQSLSLAFSQATSAGKLQGQDLMQLINAGFNPLQVISEHTGKSMSQLKDEMSKGQISAEMLAQAFTWATEEGGLFYQGAEKAGQTLSGRMNQMKDSVDEMLVAVFGAIEPILSPLVDFATKAISAIGNGISRVIGWFKKGGTGATVFGIALGSLAAGLVALKVQALAAAAAVKIKAAFDAMATVSTLGFKAAMDALNLSFLASPIFWIVAAVVALVAAIAYVIYKTEGWGKTWHNVTEYCKLSFQQMGEWLRLKWLQIADFFMTGFETIEIGWYKLQSLWDSDAVSAGLNKIQQARDQRAAEIADAQNKVDELAAKRQEMKVWEVTWNSDKKLSDVTGGVKSKLGINSQLADNVNGEGGGGGGDEAGKAANAVATGGTRNTQITINLGKMADINFNGSVGENAEDIEKKFEELFLRVLFMAQNA